MDTNVTGIGWDRKLTAKKIKEGVQRVDAIYAQRGLVDLKTGQRLPLPPEERIMKPDQEIEISPKLIQSTDELFNQSGKPSYFLTMVEGRTEEEILAKFDHPEKLGVRFMGRYAIVYLKEEPSV